MTTPKRTLLILVTSTLVACQAVAPALKALAVAFGQNLIASASANYTPRYAVEMEALLIALARETTGLELQAMLAQQGYQPPPPDYSQNGGSGSSSGQNNPYGQSNDGYSTADNSGYDNSGYDTSDQPTYEDSGGYSSSSDNPYAQSSDTSDSSDANDGASVADNPYARINNTAPASDRPYPASDNPYATRSIQPIEIQADILAQRAGTNRLVAIDDGVVLRDGGSNPAAGDLLKVKFNVNCACYVYVIGVDATGYVAQIYPDPDGGTSNPVTPGKDYIVPSGNQDWWAMDEYKGVEQVFFLASYVPRDDVEQALATMANQPRNPSATQYRPVTEAAFAPSTRGLVKVKLDATNVSTANGVQRIRPTQFASKSATADVVVTRWFYHE